MGCNALLQGIFLTQGLNPYLFISCNGRRSFTTSTTWETLICIYVHNIYIYHNISVQTLSHVQLFATPWTTAHQTALSIINSHSLLKLISIESVMPSNHLILCRPLLLPPSIFPSIRVFSNVSTVRITWPKYWSFSFSISPSNEHPGLISFRMDRLDLLPIQGTQESSTSQFKSINSSALNFLYSPTLTSVHDYRKNHSLD